MSYNELKQLVLRIILSHQGRASAIRGTEIASPLGQKDDRLVRLVIRDLIAEGYPIASSVQKPYGYFLVNSPEEAAEYQRNLKNRLIEDAIRLRDFRRSAGLKLAVAKQGVLI